MWGIFWGICWKSALTWFLVFLALLIIHGPFGNTDEDSFSSVLLELWATIGDIACLIMCLSAIVLIIISIWS